MINIKGAIFDLDGTLLDSMKVWKSIGENYLIRNGFEPEKGLSQIISGMTFSESAEYFKNVYKLTYDIQDIMDEWVRNAMYLYSNELKLKKGVREYLTYLKNNNIKIEVRRLVVLTSFCEIRTSFIFYTFGTAIEEQRNKQIA